MEILNIYIYIYIYIYVYISFAIYFMTLYERNTGKRIHVINEGRFMKIIIVQEI